MNVRLDEYLTGNPDLSYEQEFADDATSSPASQESDDQFKKAYYCSIRLLTQKEYSVFKLRRKLLERNFSSAICNLVIEKLVDANFLSDKRYAEARIRGLIRKNYSPDYIQHRLRQEQLHISLEVIYNIFEEVKVTPTDQVKNLILKKDIGPNDLENDHNKMAKLIRFLNSKGHSPTFTKPIIYNFLRGN